MNAGAANGYDEYFERFLKSVVFVERHLFDAISVHEIASASHYSTYHFCRIFKALVGDSPKEYLRKRRLTVASARLLNDEVGILELALECQFSSQEAFTRAFKSQFQVTPALFRKRGEPCRLLCREQFSPSMLRHLQHSLSMEPEIVTRQAMKVVGIATKFEDSDLDLATLWSSFRPFKNSIANRVDEHAFGIYESYVEQEEKTGFTYICSVQVSNFDNVPTGLLRREIPQQLCARFVHKGPCSELDLTLKYIWGSWLPKSAYRYSETPDLELYPQGFDDADPENILILLIPIESR